jgi:hypothetical protein
MDNKKLTVEIFNELNNRGAGLDTDALNVIGQTLLKAAGIVSYLASPSDELLLEIAEPFQSLVIGGREIVPDSGEEFRGVSHRELFSFINDLLQHRACKIKERAR